jgi:hypothetical protein
MTDATRPRTNTRTRHVRAVAALVCGLAPLATAQQQVPADIRLQISNPASLDLFGSDVDVSGNIAIVGAPRRGAANFGRAWLFDATTGEQLFQLQPDDNPSNQAGFGESVAISGNLAIVGAPLKQNNFSGAAYIFDVTTGEQLYKLRPADPGAGDEFGISVDICGTTAIIGSYKDNDAGPDSGSAYIFDASTGTELRKLTADDAVGGHLFGNAVAIDGNHAIVGAPLHSDACSVCAPRDTGAAYVFDVTTGEQVAQYFGANEPDDSQYGFAVAISGDVVVVGAWRNFNLAGAAGVAYIYSLTNLADRDAIEASIRRQFANFGFSVAVEGSLIAVGANGVEVNGNAAAGAVSLLDAETGEEHTVLFAADGEPSDQFGYSVAIDGGTVIVGAAFATSNSSGAAYISFPPAVVTEHPQPAIVTEGETAVFTVDAQAADTMSFQWRRDGVDLVDSATISGAQSRALSITAAPQDTGTYDCVITNQFNSTATAGAVLAVRPDPNDCVADLAPPIGELTFGDISAFLAAFSAGCP